MSRLSLGVVAVVMLASGCGSSSPPAGKTCVVNSDCNNPLSCTFGKCHIACKETRDCSPGQRCVKVPNGSVCQLDEEKRCPATGTCQQPLICAIDLLCHGPCVNAATDCPPSQVCASGACAEPSEVSSDGKLKPATDAGAGGTGGGGGTGGSGGMADAGVDAPPTTGNGPCGVPETEPNDTRDTAVPLTAPTMFTSCIGKSDDVDFYELVGPSDVTGGYYVISITGISDWTAYITAYTASDNVEMGHFLAASDGGNLHTFLAAAPGQKYRLAVSGFGGVRNAPSRYTLQITYTKIADAQEPNNTRETGKAISLGTAVEGYLFEGAKTTPVKAEDVSDWYTVMVPAAGNVTAAVTSVPTNTTAWVQIFDPNGEEEHAFSPNDGANTSVTFMGRPAGAYRVLVRPFTVREDEFFGQTSDPTEVPANYKTPYKLTVSQ